MGDTYPLNLSETYVSHRISSLSTYLYTTHSRPPSSRHEQQDGLLAQLQPCRLIGVVLAVRVIGLLIALPSLYVWLPSSILNLLLVRTG